MSNKQNIATLGPCLKVFINNIILGNNIINKCIGRYTLSIYHIIILTAIHLLDRLM